MYKRLEGLSIQIMMTALLAMLSIAPVIARQARERTIKNEPWLNEPVKTTKLKVKGRPVGFEQKFEEEDDWLKGLTLSVKNTSGKAITYLKLELFFPRPQDEPFAQETPFAYPLTYGYSPLLETLIPPAVPRSTPPPIHPNKTLDIVVSDADYSKLKEFLQNEKYLAAIKQVTVVLREVGFEDGSVWRSGRHLQRNPNEPRKWNPVKSPQEDVSERQPETPILDGWGSGMPAWSSSYNQRGISIRKVSLTNPAWLMLQYCLTPGQPQVTRCSKDGCANIDDTIDPQFAIGKYKFIKQRSVCESYIPGVDCTSISAGDQYVAKECVPVGEGCDYRPCASNWEWNSARCKCQLVVSPVVVDVAGDGFSLTDYAHGVAFDITGAGVTRGVSWTSAGADDAWLAAAPAFPAA